VQEFETVLITPLLAGLPILSFKPTTGLMTNLISNEELNNYTELIYWVNFVNSVVYLNKPL